MSEEKKRRRQKPRVITVMRVARERAGIAQHELAPMIGVTQRMISAWENKRAPIPAARRAEIAKILGVPAERLDSDPILSL